MATFLLLLQAAGPSGVTSILASPAVMLILLFGVFYFLLIRPQQKRQRALQDLVAQLKAGDRIITTGGIIATVTAVRDNSLIVRSADKSMLEITRGAVAGLQAEETKS